MILAPLVVNAIPIGGWSTERTESLQHRTVKLDQQDLLQQVRFNGASGSRIGVLLKLQHTVVRMCACVSLASPVLCGAGLVKAAWSAIITRRLSEVRSKVAGFPRSRVALRMRIVKFPLHRWCKAYLPWGSALGLHWVVSGQQIQRLYGQRRAEPLSIARNTRVARLPADSMHVVPPARRY